MSRVVLWTIGHSTCDIEDLVTLLTAHGISRLVDVRTVPGSRRNPQFNRDAMPEPLARAGIAYVHMPGLGGLRKPRKDSVNTGWRNAGFRGFADYMATPEFETSLTALVEQARAERVAYMCAEAVPWRCHRSLISDALTARGHEVRHILTATRADPHTMTDFAVVRDGRVAYPGARDAETAQPDLPLGQLQRRRG